VTRGRSSFLTIVVCAGVAPLAVPAVSSGQATTDRAAQAAVHQYVRHMFRPVAPIVVYDCTRRPGLTTYCTNVTWKLHPQRSSGLFGAILIRETVAVEAKHTARGWQLRLIGRAVLPS